MNDWYTEYEADVYEGFEYGNSVADIIERYGRDNYEPDND